MTDTEQHQHPPKAEYGEKSSPIAWTSVFISTGAIALAVVHVICPDFTIDSITLGLLAIAVLPWLSSLFNSIELPGGWKFEFRELKKEITQHLEAEGQKVQEINTRIKRVEEFFFSGAITPDLRDSLLTSLRQYHKYMQEVGFKLPENTPDIHIASEHEKDPILGDASNNAYYDGQENRIVIGEKIANEKHIVLREYTHHILMDLLKDKSIEFQMKALESGLADYFPCSFKNDPNYWGRSIINQHLFSEPFEQWDYWSRGSIWGGVLWEIRGKLAAGRVDQIALTTWKSIAELPGSSKEKALRDAFVGSAANDTEKNIILEIFTTRQLG